jgi:glucose/arabinose dehydrogenase
MRYAAAIGALALLTLSGPAAAQAPLQSRIHARGFDRPIAIAQDPTDPAVQFVVEQAGRIRAIRSGAVVEPDVLDLRAVVLAGGERGLLGLAFAPDYASSGRFFVNFTNRDGDTVVARFRRSAAPLVADPASRFDLRWRGATAAATIPQPFSNHNGGHLLFGPDGYLYVGLGDGGSGDDPQHRAQAPGELLGKMLRVDVGVADTDPIGYRIPQDNPFIGRGPAGTRQEIWSFGLRNPWRYSFDDPARGGTGAMLIGDVGQSSWEEIDYEPPRQGGRNYGWRNREGAHDHVGNLAPAFGPLIDPIWEYDRSQGSSVTGGVVYRGRSLGTAYQGRYFFADFVRGTVWSVALQQTAGGEATATNLINHTADLAATNPLGSVSSFGIDADGELFVLDYSNGAVLRIVGTGPAPEPEPEPPPEGVPARPTGLRIIR